MWEKYHYIGCFFATEDFYKKVKKYRKNPLEQQIEIPHITFSYKPDKVEESLSEQRSGYGLPDMEMMGEMKDLR